MKHLLTLIFLSLLISQGSQAQQFAWARQSLGDGATVRGVCSDNSGSVYVTGDYDGSTTFEGILLPDTQNIFIAKYNEAGVLQWLQSAGGNNDAGLGIATNGNGEVYITGKTGSFGGPRWFGNTLLESSGGADAFVAKLDANGDFLWAHNMPSTGGVSDENIGYGIAVNGDGDCFVVGNFSETSYFGGDAAISLGGTDAFLAKYDKDGNYEWVRTGNGTGGNTGRHVVLDGIGNIYVAGNFATAINFSGTQVDAIGGTNYFVAAYDASGNLMWANWGGSNGGEDIPVGLGMDNQGNLYTAHESSGFHHIGDSTLNYISQIIVATLNPNGEFVRISSGADVWLNPNHLNAMTVMGDGTVYLVGDYDGVLASPIFGPDTLNTTAFTGGFISKLSPDGIIQGAHAMGSFESYMRPKTVCSSANGWVYFGGEFNFKQGFGTDTLDAAGTGTDAFITRFDGTDIENPGGTTTMGAKPISDLSIQLFPNPSNGSIHFRLPVNNDQVDTQVKVVDAMGRIHHRGSFTGNQGTLHLQDLSPGMYWVQISTGANQFVRTIMLQP